MYILNRVKNMRGHTPPYALVGSPSCIKLSTILIDISKENIRKTNFIYKKVKLEIIK